MNPAHAPSGDDLAAAPDAAAGLAVTVDGATAAAARLVAAADLLVAALAAAIPPGSLAAPDRPAGGRSRPAARDLAARWMVATRRWADDVAAHAYAVERGTGALAAADDAGARQLRGAGPR